MGKNWEAEWMNAALTLSVSVTPAPLQFRRLTADICGCTWEQHIPRVTQVPHRQHWAHQQTARGMKRRLRVWSHRQRRCVRLQRGTPEDQTLCHYQIIVSADSGHDAPSLHERGLVVGIQTADIQSKEMVTKTRSRSQRQRWLTASLAASLLRSGNSCKKSFCFSISRARTHTHTRTSVCYVGLWDFWFSATPLLSEVKATVNYLTISTCCGAASAPWKVYGRAFNLTAQKSLLWGSPVDHRSYRKRAAAEHTRPLLTTLVASKKSLDPLDSRFSVCLYHALKPQSSIQKEQMRQTAWCSGNAPDCSSIQLWGISEADCYFTSLTVLIIML